MDDSFKTCLHPKIQKSLCQGDTGIFFEIYQYETKKIRERLKIPNKGNEKISIIKPDAVTSDDKQATAWGFD